jgi:hypothetical protein
VAPDGGLDDRARPGPVRLDPAAFEDEIGERRHERNYPSMPATCWNQATSGGGK